MYTTNYTRLATIKPVVLSSSAYRHYGASVFPEGRRTSVTLVYSPDSFVPLFKLGNKTPLFTASNNIDGTVTLASTNVNFPSWLTIAGTDLIRLCKKAEMDIDEPFMSLDEHLAFHYEPTDELPVSTFVTPTLADCDDLADFADASLDSYYASPTRHQSIISRKLPNGKWQRRGGRTPRPTRKKPASRRITRKTLTNKRRFDPATYTPAQFNQDVATLWG